MLSSSRSSKNPIKHAPHHTTPFETGAMEIITPGSLNKLIDDTGRAEIGKAFNKQLLSYGLCVVLIGTTLFGLTNAVVCGVLILALVIWAQRQTKVGHEAARQIQTAFTQRGLHAPALPTHRWKAEVLVDALREYDAAKKV